MQLEAYGLDKTGNPEAPYTVTSYVSTITLNLTGDAEISVDVPIQGGYAPPKILVVVPQE